MCNTASVQKVYVLIEFEESNYFVYNTIQVPQKLPRVAVSKMYFLRVYVDIILQHEFEYSTYEMWKALCYCNGPVHHLN